eukprot:m.11326 g.11326  ORF g.11326 m.11326 type:complete len:56 (-) comp6472_c0_seq1:62-229(-)
MPLSNGVGATRLCTREALASCFPPLVAFNLLLRPSQFRFISYVWSEMFVFRSYFL